MSILAMSGNGEQRKSENGERKYPPTLRARDVVGKTVKVLSLRDGPLSKFKDADGRQRKTRIAVIDADGTGLFLTPNMERSAVVGETFEVSSGPTDSGGVWYGLNPVKRAASD